MKKIIIWSLVSAVIIFLSVAIWFYSGLGEMQAQARDSQRTNDLVLLQQAISVFNVMSKTSFSCESGQVFRSDKGSISADGTGWLPLNLMSLPGGGPIATLPTDPINKGDYVYQAICEGNILTLTLKIESNKYKDKMLSDNGANPNLYELVINLSNTPSANILPSKNNQALDQSLKCKQLGESFEKKFESDNYLIKLGVSDVAFIEPIIILNKQMNACLMRTGYEYNDHGGRSTDLFVFNLNTGNPILKGSDAVRYNYEPGDPLYIDPKTQNILSLEEFDRQTGLLMSQ